MIIKGLKILLLREVEASMENYLAKVQREEELYSEEYERRYGEPPTEEFVYKPMGFGEIIQQVFWNKFKSAGECAGWLWQWGWYLACIVATVITLVVCRAITTVDSILSTNFDKFDTAAWVAFVCYILLTVEIIMLAAMGKPRCIRDLTEKPAEAKAPSEEAESEPEETALAAEEETVTKPDVAAQNNHETTVKTARRVTEIEERKVRITEEGSEIKT